MKPKSETLFHFTKNSGTLKQILKNGFWPRYCLEDVSWMKAENVEFVAFPMVCFCDIPLSRVDEHVGFYGEYGIGLTKEWAMSNGLAPIHYISPNSKIPGTYEALANIQDSLEEAKIEESRKLMRYLFAHTKPVEGNMVIQGEIIKKEFHQECEWRYIPQNGNIHEFLNRQEYNVDELLAGRNSETRKNCSLQFSPKDVKYIFVKQDSDIPNIINFIQTDLDHHPSAEIKILMSRVTSLESIVRDL